MQTIEFAGKKFQCEKLHEDNFKHGPCAFKMVDEDGDTTYLVFTPSSVSESDKEIKTPNDGVLCAGCPSEQSALMVASSICMAATFANLVEDKKAEVERDVEKLAEQLGFDLEKLDAEVKRLKAEGKSSKEVAEILKPRMEEFKKKPATTDKGGEW
jgi:hypothetical protein